MLNDIIPFVYDFRLCCKLTGTLRISISSPTLPLAAREPPANAGEEVIFVIAP